MARTRKPALLPGLTDNESRLPDRHAGVDEVGRGCLAGPVVACALVLPPATSLPGLDDSKKLTARQREELARRILDQARALGLGLVPPARIDEINILQATFEAMALALRQLVTGEGRKGALDGYPDPLTPAACQGPPDRPDLVPCADFAAIGGLVLVDGNKTVPEETLARILEPGHDLSAGFRWQAPFRQRAIVGGDGKVPAISAASIVAKTWRDRLMTQLDERFPGYGLANHKGYGTKEHLQALKRLGPSPIHRLTFAGVRPKRS